MRRLLVSVVGGVLVASGCGGGSDGQGCADNGGAPPVYPATGKLLTVSAYFEAPGELDIDVTTREDLGPAAAAANLISSLAVGTCQVGDMRFVGARTDVGPMTVTGLCDPIELAFVEGLEYRSDPDAACYQPCATVTARGAGGGGVGPFEGSVVLPDAELVTSPSFEEVDLAEGIPVRWERSASPADATYIGLVGADGYWDTVTCRVSDSGDFVVPADVLMEAGAAPGMGGILFLARANFTSFSAEGLEQGVLQAWAVSGTGFGFGE